MTLRLWQAPSLPISAEITASGRFDNRELVLLYWPIGQDILGRRGAQGWGAKVIDRLAHDLRAAFPDVKGFSPRNLKYMRGFSEAWPEVEFVQAGLVRFPWYHPLALRDKLPGPETRCWYAARAIEHNWSRHILVMQIESRLLERSGKAVTNFEARLPQAPSDLARESLKDSYTFDFLGLTALARQVKSERDHPSIEQIERELGRDDTAQEDDS